MYLGLAKPSLMKISMIMKEKYQVLLFIVKTDRVKKKGGGLAVYVADQLVATRRPRCEVRIRRVSESNRCHIAHQGCRERTTLGRRYFFPPTL